MCNELILQRQNRLNLCQIILFMRTAQNTNKLISTFQNTTFPPPPTQEKFSLYFQTQLANLQQINKSSRITSSSEYMATFEQYAKNGSYIDNITNAFDNAIISHFYLTSPELILSSSTLLTLPHKIQNNVASINSFFNPKIIGRADLHKIEPLYLKNYVSYLSVITVPADKFPKEQQIVILQTKQSQIFKELQKDIRETDHSILTSKVDLLLAQIRFQKKNRQSSERYIEAVQIKLQQFINYVLQEDDRYLGLSLQDKLSEIMLNLEDYRGKTIDGWLKLLLIEIFFQQFKQLQLLKLSTLKKNKKNKYRDQVYSQVDRLSIESPSNKGQYTEPNTRANRQR